MMDMCGGGGAFDLHMMDTCGSGGTIADKNMREKVLTLAT
jgi:hypothetical protein